MGESHVIESGNLIISVQVLKNVTKNFSHENELGRGGFEVINVIYKGQLHDGTKIAVKEWKPELLPNTKTQKSSKNKCAPNAALVPDFDIIHWFEPIIKFFRIIIIIIIVIIM